MVVRGIVADLFARAPQTLAVFNADVGHEIIMDDDFIATLAGAGRQTRSNLRNEGGSGTPVTAISIEVDDQDDFPPKARSTAAEITDGPASDPWGVRRFFMRGPAGNLANVLSH